VPLAQGRHGPGGAAGIVSMALLGLNVSVDRVGNGGVGAACFVLVNDAARSLSWPILATRLMCPGLGVRAALIIVLVT